MAAIDELLARVPDPALREALQRELAPLRGERELGLVFERHMPEKVRLPGLPVRRHSLVEIRSESDSPTWRVTRVEGDKAYLSRKAPVGPAVTEIREVDELVVVREFGDPIYPGLRSLGRIAKGGDKPFHAVIKAENYHALETLLYTSQGQVDVVYLDPPYNNRAKDWKYNNDFVDTADRFRHSKWLSFMEKRLRLARKLLRPDKSVLIVTIDEAEVHRLGILLHQLFPGTTQQMVSITINPKGTARPNEFSRVDEYAFVVLFGSAVVPAVQVGSGETKVRWRYLRRNDNESIRGSRPRQFYPIYVDTNTSRIVHIGEPLDKTADRHTAPERRGAVAVFPVREDGVEMEWGLTGPSLRKALDQGYVRVTPGYEQQPFIFSYLTAPNIKKIESGELLVSGVRPDGSKEVVAPNGKSARPTTVWREKSHDAGAHGTSLIGELLPGRSFPFPKSLYAVEDMLRLFVGDNPNALVLDFFGGSGTTTHAVARLNHQDGGARRSVLITNNELSPAEAAELAEAGHRPGDPQWEAQGIFEYITRPRLEAALTGLTPDGKPIAGEYKFTDEFAMSQGFEENLEFFELSYEDPDRVQLGTAYAAVAPMLWLMAGASGPRVDEAVGGWCVPEGGRYGVLFDTNAWPDFCQSARDNDTLTHAFVVTDSEAVFQRVAAELPADVQAVRLYESYLTTFAINTGDSS
ncbi:DNA methyltransferase [Blastococcus sp. SYSU DS0552]